MTAWLRESLQKRRLNMVLPSCVGGESSFSFAAALERKFLPWRRRLERSSRVTRCWKGGLSVSTRFTGSEMENGSENSPPKKRKAGTVYCCVVSCHNSVENTRNREPRITFHSFPGKWYETARREAWVAAVHRENPDGSSWQPTTRSKICSAHFVDNCVSNIEGSPSYVPTIFPPVYRRKVPDAERHKRWLKWQSNAQQHAVTLCDTHADELEPLPVSQPLAHDLDVVEPNQDGELETLADVASEAPKQPTHTDVGTETDGPFNSVDAACQVNHTEQLEKATCTESLSRRK